MKAAMDPQVKSLTMKICILLILTCIVINGSIAIVLYCDSRSQEQKQSQELQKKEERLVILEQRLKVISDQPNE